MKKSDLLSLLSALAAPIALTVVGVVLFLVPDTGSILLSKILGWCLSLAGMAALLWAIASREWGKLVICFILVSAGSALLARPLVLAAYVGRFLGILLLCRNLSGLFRSATRKGKFLSGILSLTGLLLIAMPMGASRLVFAGCGAVLALCGAGLLLQRLREYRYLTGRRDDIIDAL